MTQSYSSQSEDQWTVNSCREVLEDGGQHNTACPTTVSKSTCPPFSTVLSHYVPHIASVRTMLVLGIGGRVLVAGVLQGWPLWEEVSSSATDPLQDTAETIKAGGISRKTYKRNASKRCHPGRAGRKLQGEHQGQRRSSSMVVQMFMAARGAPTLEQMDMPEGPWRAHAGAEEVCEEEGAGAPGHPAVPPCCRT